MKVVFIFNNREGSLRERAPSSPISGLARSARAEPEIVRLAFGIAATVLFPVAGALALGSVIDGVTYLILTVIALGSLAIAIVWDRG